VVVVDCDDSGNVDVADLKAKAEQHADKLACLMITYPSTHGVFEEAIREICAIVHQHGGQVYMDGANMNAQVGLTSPATIGADVSHMNLHKTFCIPHGGGGPGMGPIGLKAHLAPFMANHVVAGDRQRGSPQRGPGRRLRRPLRLRLSILPISWMYITMMGGRGLTAPPKTAILNANYVASEAQGTLPGALHRQQGPRRPRVHPRHPPHQGATGIAEMDIAKRLMDYGFHAPPSVLPGGRHHHGRADRIGDKAELDRFIAAMVSIRDEIRKIENGPWPADNNPLKNAPHTQADFPLPTGTVPTPARKPSSPCHGCATTSSGRA
jgi:glycine dehydrogenase